MSTSRSKNTLHRLAVGGALIAAAAVPLAVAVPAQAATSSGCTVTPLRPVFAGFNSSGTKLVRFSVQISCSENRTVTVQQQRYEEDWDGWLFSDSDDYLGARTFVCSFVGAGSNVVSSVRTLPNTEDGNEEIYQRTRFQVSSNGVTSPLTSWQRTPYVSMPN
jgi:hypothetical protein